MKINCPTCGNPVRRRAKVCPNCGRDLTGLTANPPTPVPGTGWPQSSTSQPSSTGFPQPPGQPSGSGWPQTPTQPPGGAGFPQPPPGGAGFPQPPPQGPFSPTGMGSSGGRSVRTILVLLVALGVIGGAVFLIRMVTAEVRKGLDTVSVLTSPSAFHIHIVEPTPADGKKGDTSQEFKSARETFNAMNAHGAKCKNFDLAIDTDLVSAATCFAGLEAWTIQVFFDDLSYDSVVNGYKTNDSIHVAYGGNWTVLTQSKASSKKIAKALGGRAT